ncbi:MAG: DUF4012 domain-containing protein, partial [Chloroflexota bacterium]|nr:DUF4012 domain-containing protein [Chloroflexota bacterium]
MKQTHALMPLVPVRIRRPFWSRRRLRTLLVCALMLLAGGSLVALRATALRQELKRGANELNLSVTAFTRRPPLELESQDLEEGRQHLQQAEEALRAARGELALWEPLLSFAGGDAGAVVPLTDVALHGAIAGQQFYESLKPLYDWVQAFRREGTTATPQGKEKIAEAISLLRAARPGLGRAREELKGALAAYDSIDRASSSGEIAEMVTRLDKYAPQLRALDDIAGVLIDAPDLLTSLVDSGDQKTYLVLAQNNDELRPLGGFISTFGVLVMRDGQLVAHHFGTTTDSPNLMPPSEPCPSRSPEWWIQLKIPVWGCWDTQWTGDFPTMAQQAKWFYEHGNNPYSPVDGVIALDQTGMGLLLNALGPVNVPEYNEVVTGTELRSKVYYYRLKAQESQEGALHKEFLGGIFKALVTRDLTALIGARAPAFIEALRECVARKHLLFYFTDPKLQGAISKLGADGTLRSTEGDYLYVVDTSLQEKVFGSISEQIEYSALIGPDDIVTGEATIT